MSNSSSSSPEFPVPGNGQAVNLIRSFNWNTTSLGDPRGWPSILRHTLGILLPSAFPMFLMWEEELICFYNDAFIPYLGKDGRHPAIGKKARDVWPDTWEFASPLIQQVRSTGKPVFLEDQPLSFGNTDPAGQSYWTFCYSPVYNDNGQVQGVLATCIETTEKVKTIKKLAVSEKRFQSLISEATVGIIVLMGEQNITEVVNEAFASLVSRSIEELEGKPVFEVIPEAEPYFREIIDEVRAGGMPKYLYGHPFFIIENGKKREGFLNLVYQPYREEKDDATGVMILCHDVTTQVMARKKMEETELRLRSLVESAPFPIGVYTGPEMLISLANESIMEVWGKGNQVVGKRYKEILPELDNQDIFNQIDSVYTTGIPFHAKHQRVDLMINQKMQSHYFNYSFTPLFDTDRRIYGVMNTAAEVTDLVVAKQKVEQSEKNFRNIILQAPVAMCILIGPEHVVEVANDIMIGLWGKPRASVMNRPIFEGLPDAREQGLEELLNNVFRTGETFSASERPVDLFRNGRTETVYQNFVYEPYRDSDGTILGVLAISIDVTNQVLSRQKIEEVVMERTRALAEVNEHLQRSNAELAQYAYIASHDLQEPLRKISIFTSMLETSLGEMDARSSKYINKIKIASGRMMTLIKDVLAYSELSQTGHTLESVNLQKLIEEIINDFELLIEQKNAVIETDGLPTVTAIPLHMSQLFGNLISNALKFTVNGIAPVIRIQGSLLPRRDIALYQGLSDQQSYYKIEVCDNGIGFNQENASQIFNIFQRLHAKKDFEGTGIGLALCQKIVHNHHGDIRAIASPGNGACFEIILPVNID